MQRLQHIGQPGNRLGQRAAVQGQGEHRLEVADVARQRGGEVAGDQQVAVADGVQLDLRGGSVLPERQHADGQCGSEGEGQEQQVMQAQAGVDAAAEAGRRGGVGLSRSAVGRRHSAFLMRCGPAGSPIRRARLVVAPDGMVWTRHGGQPDPRARAILYRNHNCIQTVIQ